MVYSAPYDGSGASTVQWAFTFWDYEAATDASYSAPVGYAYSWASYEFLYEGYGRSSVDAHTFVHETGHLLGLNDYYDTSGSTSPTGYVDMMDANIIDHCAYTKFSLGWISPYVVTGEGSITIGNLAEAGDAVLIPTKASANTSCLNFMPQSGSIGRMPPRLIPGTASKASPGQASGSTTWTRDFSASSRSMGNTTFTIRGILPLRLRERDSAGRLLHGG